jgi:hypothetical protein
MEIERGDELGFVKFGIVILNSWIFDFWISGILFMDF